MAEGVKKMKKQNESEERIEIGQLKQRVHKFLEDEEDE